MEKSIAKEIKDIDNLIVRRISKGSYQMNNISSSQMHIIIYLINHLNSDVYQKDIEQDTGLRRSTLSGIIDTMIKNGLVLKTNSSVDGRSKKIVLTEKVLNKRKECLTKFMSLDDILTKKISLEELEMFFKVTHQIKENLKEEESNV